MFIETRHGFFTPDAGADCLTLFFSETLGICVRALVGFPAGAVLDKFAGNIGPQLTQHSLQVSPDRHITGTRFVGFLAHSCDPNCRLEMQNRELVALRKIAPGDLLTIDYAASEDVLYRQFACDCGASACKGWIVGRKETAQVPAAPGQSPKAI